MDEPSQNPRAPATFARYTLVWVALATLGRQGLGRQVVKSWAVQGHGLEPRPRGQG